VKPQPRLNHQKLSNFDNVPAALRAKRAPSTALALGPLLFQRFSCAPATATPIATLRLGGNKQIIPVLRRAADHLSRLLLRDSTRQLKRLRPPQTEAGHTRPLPRGESRHAGPKRHSGAVALQCSTCTEHASAGQGEPTPTPGREKKEHESHST
jgi:hypothetical protein